MNLLKPVLLVLVLSLGGCAWFQANPETPAQKLYALKIDYRSLLTTMVGYRAQCEAKEVSLRRGCEEHVRKMQEIDSEVVWPAVMQAQGAADLGQSVELASANAIVLAAVAHLNAYIIANHVGPGVDLANLEE